MTSRVAGASSKKSQPDSLENVPILRTSERSTFKRCQQRWWWEYREGLIAPGRHANALWFGIGMHLALQERYKFRGLKRGRNMLKVWRDYVNDEVTYVRTLPQGNSHIDEEPVWVEAGELGEAMIGAYLDKYGKDERWYVIATEREFVAHIGYPTGYAPAGHPALPLVRFMSRLDLVARDEDSEHGDLWLWDHKNLKAIKTNHLPMDDQMGAYWALAPQALVDAGVLKKAEPLEGIMYNILRKAKPDPRPRNAVGQCLNKDGTVSKQQPAPLFHREPIGRTRREANTQIRRIQNEVLQMNALRDRPGLVIKTTGEDCNWCQFYDMCSLHESGDDWEELRDAMFKVQDPYSDYKPGND